MNIFVNISHPAHFYFFYKAIQILKNRGHNIIIGARDKEFVLDLLDSKKLEYCLLTEKGDGLIGLVGELLKQQFLILKIVKRQSIDIMLQIGGIFNAPVGKLLKIPTLAFSDTENDIWGNKFSFNLSSNVYMPSCFDHKYGGNFRNQIHYNGYHELAYLNPNEIGEVNEPKNKILFRFVGWGAGHDIGEKSLSNKQKIELVVLLKQFGDIYISSEKPLPIELNNYKCNFHQSKIHGFMRKCKLIIGESATMASEAACMGIPAIFISNTGRGYTTEQDQKYGLIKHFKLDQWEDLLDTLHLWASSDLYKKWQMKRVKMLKEKMDVTQWLVDVVENYPNKINPSHNRYQIDCFHTNN